MSRPVTLRQLAAVGLAAMALGACGDSDDTASGADSADTVTIQGVDFTPDSVEVDAGTTITFVNEDSVEHTVTAGTPSDPNPDEFDGRLADKGATFDLTLDDAGDHQFFCEVHPTMTGTVTVR